MTSRIKIELLSGQAQGSVKEFDKPHITVGSLLSDDISFKGYSNILPGHISIRLENNKVLLVNNCMASIYINGEEKREAKLIPGDEIRFGKDGPCFKFLEWTQETETIEKEELLKSNLLLEKTKDEAVPEAENKEVSHPVLEISQHEQFCEIIEPETSPLIETPKQEELEQKPEEEIPLEQKEELLEEYNPEETNQPDMISTPENTFEEMKALTETFDDNKYQQTVQKYHIEENVYTEDSDPSAEEFNLTNIFYKKSLSVYEECIEKWLIGIFLIIDIFIDGFQEPIYYERVDYNKKSSIQISEIKDKPALDDAAQTKRSSLNCIKIFENLLIKGILFSAILSFMFLNSIINLWISAIIAVVALYQFKAKTYIPYKPEFLFMFLPTGIIGITNALSILITLVNFSHAKMAVVINNVSLLFFLTPIQIFIVAYIAYRISKN